ncbi:uncharacterized protein F4822DRAFT_425071 [Hypoxylon trugodes]|uniref:uncharacterized protein n=1 Tax=Hypoxylon trugodes TaxID=326681 RepID=UPI0021986662|nr:uncharacterized protein F4822DRAFT_425071 [Hypoxylon trugodes]KAI1391849.1 hypothetical protein F4822DRAFT_425071 [Hypoxylon trugodes]
MPSAQPTCAARIIRNKFLLSGWGATLSTETNQLVLDLRADAAATYQLQVLRDRPISSISLRSALFWEHHHLAEQRIISTPSIDDELELELFSASESFETGYDKIKKEVSANHDQVTMHSLFGPIRDREFTVWTFRVNGVWVTVILRIEPMLFAPAGERFCDRTVTRFYIVDSLPTERESRARLLDSRLPDILKEGGIDLQIKHTPISTPNVDYTWATGHVAYAFSREFMRRLKILLFRRQRGETPMEFLFEPFEEHFDVDYYRELMISASAHYAIEKSNYQVRLALEVPSEKSKYDSKALKRVKIDAEKVEDEVYIRDAHNNRPIVVSIPKGTFKPSEDDLQQPSAVPDCDEELDEADYDDSDYEPDENKSTPLTPIPSPPAAEPVAPGAPIKPTNTMVKTGPVTQMHDAGDTEASVSDTPTPVSKQDHAVPTDAKHEEDVHKSPKETIKYDDDDSKSSTKRRLSDSDAEESSSKRQLKEVAGHDDI